MRSISIDEVRDILLKVLNDERSREAANEWAHQLMEANDSGSLTYISKGYLGSYPTGLGIDLKDSPDSYLHDRKNILDWLSKLRK
jgi:hypothetical protein